MRKDRRTPSGNIQGKPGITYPEGSIAHPTIIERQDERQNATPTAFLAAHPVVTGAKLIQQSKEEGDNHNANVTTVFETLPSPLLTGRTISDAAQGAMATIATQRVASGTADFEPDWKTLGFTETPIDANRKQRETVALSDTAFPILTEYDQDEETAALITTTYQVVQASAVVAPTIVAGQITRYRKIDKWRSLKIVTTFSTPASYSEFRFAAHTFPTLFSSLSYDEPCGAIYNMRSGFSAFTDCRVDISFGAYDSSISGLQIKPNTFSITKFFRISDVLNDAATYTLTGACSGSISIPASSPSKTTYSALIGTFQLISGESVLWKAGRFRTTKLYYRML